MLTGTTVFCRVSAHVRVIAHPPFLAFLAIWGGARVSAHPSPFDLEARVDIQASAQPVLLCVHIRSSRAVRCQKRQVLTVPQVRLVPASGDRRRLPVTRQVIDPPRADSAASFSQRASDMVRKRRDLDRATRVLGFARTLL